MRCERLNLEFNDHIQIKDLQIFANHGVYPEENQLGQKFLISADLYLPLQKAGMQDALASSVNYGEVSQVMTKYLQTHTFQLIETAAEKLAWHLLKKFPLLDGVSLELKKPWAPIGLPLDTVSVKITRFWHTAYIALGSN